MKFVIIGDLHGTLPRMHYKEFDAIIAPGDFCSDKGIRELIWASYKEFLKNPYEAREWWEIVGKKRASKLIKNSLKAGRKILRKLDSFGVPVYIVPGNWDWAETSSEKWDFLNKDFFNDFLLKDLKNVVDVDGKIKRMKDWQIIGYGKCSGPELLKYRHYRGIKKEDFARNEKAYKKLKYNYTKLFRTAKKPVIFLSHNVPYNTPLDKIRNRDSPMNGHHYGSVLAREMIKKFGPLVCIGAHMHEHFGKCRLGKTTVINAGFGPRVNVLVELDKNKIKKLEFYKR